MACKTISYQREICLFRIVPGFLLALGTVHYITHFQLIRRLELAHGQPWIALAVVFAWLSVAWLNGYIEAH